MEIYDGFPVVEGPAEINGHVYVTVDTGSIGVRTYMDGTPIFGSANAFPVPGDRNQGVPRGLLETLGYGGQ